MKWLKLPFEVLAESRKARALIVALVLVMVAPLLGRLGVDLSSEQVEQALLMLGTYIVGQGIADLGSGSKKLSRKK